MQHLSSEDLAVAICAVYLSQQEQLVSSGRLSRLMGLPTGDCRDAILRLNRSRVMRGMAVPPERWGTEGDRFWVSSVAVVRLLKSVSHLFPIADQGPQRVMGRGILTSFSAPAFQGQVVFRRASVWACSREHIGENGVLVEPMFASLPERVADLLCSEAGLTPQDREDVQNLYTMFSCVDALREGRAREYRIAAEVLGEIMAIPEKMWRAA